MTASVDTRTIVYGACFGINHMPWCNVTTILFDKIWHIGRTQRK